MNIAKHSRAFSNDHFNQLLKQLSYCILNKSLSSEWFYDWGEHTYSVLVRLNILAFEVNGMQIMVLIYG